VLRLALAFGSARHVSLILLALPSTLIGGVIAVVLTGGTLTLGAMVGFVALFGMAARNTILLVSHYDHLVVVEGRDVESRDGPARCRGTAHSRCC
jgi:multidrug efflux pump subunit AcrB